jgi:hypothetical protein
MRRLTRTRPLISALSKKLSIAALVAVSLACASAAAARPFYVCTNRAQPSRRCLSRFDAERLVGLRLPAAVRLAHSYGLEVRRVWPLAKDESLTEDLRPKRIDVICRAANEHSVIVKIKETG